MKRFLEEPVRQRHLRDTHHVRSTPLAMGGRIATALQQRIWRNARLRARARPDKHESMRGLGISCGGSQTKCLISGFARQARPNGAGKFAKSATRLARLSDCPVRFRHPGQRRRQHSSNAVLILSENVDSAADGTARQARALWGKRPAVLRLQREAASAFVSASRSASASKTCAAPIGRNCAGGRYRSTKPSRTAC